MLTTIQITKDTAEQLKACKTHPQQTYDELIRKLIDESEELLTVTEIREIQESLEDIKRQKTTSIHKIAKEVGVELHNVRH